MRRIIEELIDKRKNLQEKVKNTLYQLGQLIEQSGFIANKKKKRQISEKLIEFNDHLTQLITIQDREWDAYSNNHSTGVFKSLQWKIEKLEAEYSNVKTLLINFITLEQSLKSIIESVKQKTTSQDLSKLEQIKDQLSTYQYSDFEQRFRGDENLVKEKLKKYLPIFSSSDNILDIGCGRGEFLQLLKEQGKTGTGIDISLSMLKIAEQKGLTCQRHDALQYLKKIKSESIGGIFSAQVIEHLHPDYFRNLILESYRVLKKNSPIVLETINPLSIFALSNIYFLDVTHQKPLHPEFLRYLLESSGFDNVNIIYSEELSEESLVEVDPKHEIAKEFNTNVDKLNKILFSSLVYAATGNKNG